MTTTTADRQTAVAYRTEHIAETDSTNNWMREHGEGDMVVVADYQTAGRGCGTNTWESERGKNLLFSVLLHPTTIPAVRQFRISMAVSVALCETLDAHLASLSVPHPPLTIKWPNDIYCGDGKICGMLIENRVAGQVLAESIVGIGLNVNQQVFTGDAPNPVSLFQIAGRYTDRKALLAAFLPRMDAALARNDIHACYEARLYRRGHRHAYTDAGGTFMAVLSRVLDDGRLLLTDDDGNQRAYAFKEVAFVGKALKGR